ncbi:hypothetical protein QCA50_015900 [Cerrena zonata]|uniref:PRP28/DDX23-like helical domain-containing protein n=1 Tax=Cerrena zonata TaxID=2478898 RepID=A0AAW0FU61_9APHY
MHCSSNVIVASARHIYDHPMSNRPVSVEDIIEGSRNDNNLLSKPKFLSKQQREKFASLKQEKELTKKRYSKSKPVKRIRYEEEEGDEDELKLDKKARVKKTQKFSFDWDAHEDTSTDFNPLVAYVQPEDDLGYLGKHWSEKKLEDMDARDWRIFKDDYNITAKGGGEISNPLRSWQESVYGFDDESPPLHFKYQTLNTLPVCGGLSSSGIDSGST